MENGEITKTEAKKIGKELLNLFARYKEATISKDEFTQKSNEKLLILDKNKKNFTKIQEYIKAETSLTELIEDLSYKSKVAIINYSTLARLLDLVILSEERIKKDIEYNNLIDAIPLDAKKQISKQLITKRDIDQEINTQCSLEFISTKFKDKILYSIQLATKDFAVYDAYLFAIKTIFKHYGVSTIRAYNSKDFEEYKEVVEDIEELEEYIERQPKFRKTKVYDYLQFFTRLDKIRYTKDYKQSEDELKPQIIKLVLSQDTSDYINVKETEKKILNLCIDKLVGERWWKDED